VGGSAAASSVTSINFDLAFSCNCTCNRDRNGNCNRNRNREEQERFEARFAVSESLLFEPPKRSNQEKGGPTIERSFVWSKGKQPSMEPPPARTSMCVRSAG
jgi:hypothetical protein